MLLEAVGGRCVLLAAAGVLIAVRSGKCELLDACGGERQKLCEAPSGRYEWLDERGGRGGRVVILVGCGGLRDACLVGGGGPCAVGGGGLKAVGLVDGAGPCVDTLTVVGLVVFLRTFGVWGRGPGG